MYGNDKELFRIMRNFFTIRKFGRFTYGLFGILVLLLVCYFLYPSGRVTSAIGCKNKLAEIIFPVSEERASMLSHYSMDVTTLEDDYFHFVQTTSRMCYHQVHFGPSEDGGWDVCLDNKFDIKPPCLVYSFGIDYDFRFEEEIENKLKCEVHAFDPSMDLPDHKYSGNGTFHNIGIHYKNSHTVGGKWNMKTLSTIMQELNHDQRNIDLLKMDVEFSEWPALYEMINSGSITKVRQLIMEVHTPEVDMHSYPDHACTWSSRENIAVQLKILLKLQNLGFNTYYLRTNYRTEYQSKLTGRTRQCCHDLHMVNMNHPQNGWRAPPKRNN